MLLYSSEAGYRACHRLETLYMSVVQNSMDVAFLPWQIITFQATAVDLSFQTNPFPGHSACHLQDISLV